MISPALLIHAAVRLDAPLLCSMLGDAFARHGIITAWQQLAVPALRELGARDPAVAGHGAVEHMLSGSLLTTLVAVITLAPPARTIRPVVLACAEEEQHVLPVYALHAELAGRGVDVRQLGGRVPRQALAHAVSTVRPAAVFVWSRCRPPPGPGFWTACRPGSGSWSAAPDGGTRRRGSRPTWSPPWRRPPPTGRLRVRAARISPLTRHPARRGRCRGPTHPSCWTPWAAITHRVSRSRGRSRRCRARCPGRPGRGHRDVAAAAGRPRRGG